MNHRNISEPRGRKTLGNQSWDVRVLRDEPVNLKRVKGREVEKKTKKQEYPVEEPMNQKGSKRKRN